MTEETHVCPARYCTLYPGCYLQQLNALWSLKQMELDLCKECDRWLPFEETVRVNQMRGHFCKDCCHFCERCKKVNITQKKEGKIECWKCGNTVKLERRKL